MDSKDFTRDDVRNVYRFLLRREPESEVVVEQHFNSCSTLSNLLEAFYQSSEFQSKIDNRRPAEKAADSKKAEAPGSVKINKVSFKMVGDGYLKSFVDTEFEPDTVSLFKSLINKDDNVLDVGSNIGCTTLLFGCLAQKVVAFEPNPSTFSFLQKNIAGSGLKNIDALNIGLGKKTGKFEIAFSPNDRSGAFINDRDQAASALKKAEVSIERLDEAFARLGLPRVDFIKIDAEGFEKQVIEGAKKTIEKNRPVVVLEMNHWCLNAFQRICIPDFLDFLRTQFPILLAVEGKSCANLHDKDESYSVMYQHIINFKYMNIVCCFEESRLSRFRKIYKK